MTASPFLVAVGDLDPGIRRAVTLEGPADWGVDASRVISPVIAELGLDGHAGGVMVTGVVEATVAHTCNRCLSEFEERERVAVAQDFVTEEGADYRVTDDEIDAGPLLRDELLLAMPLAPACREDCKGLCPECGTDLNTRACSGHVSEPVSPFAELRSLFDQE